MDFNFQVMSCPPLHIAIITVVFISIVTSVISQSAPSFLDVIVFGNQDSESAHSVRGPLSFINTTSTLPLVYPQSVPYRCIGADPDHTSAGRLTAPLLSFINVTFTVHPTRRTYVTLKLYGSDPQEGIVHLYWKPPRTQRYDDLVDLGGDVLQVGLYSAVPNQQGAGYGELDLNEARFDGGNRAYPLQFYYATTVLPSFMTNGQTSLTLLIGGFGSTNGYGTPTYGPLDHSLKPIYRLYSHVQPHFIPLPSPFDAKSQLDITHFEPHTLPMSWPVLPIWSPKRIPITREQIAGNITKLRSGLDAVITSYKDHQIYGQVWLDAISNKSSPYAPPSAIYGAPSTLHPQEKYTEADWLRLTAYDATNGNNNPMTWVALLAHAYVSEWSIYYHSAEILNRTIAALDFYAVEQGANGGFLMQTITIPWNGAPNRGMQYGSPLDGVGPYALGLAVMLLHPVLNSSGVLEEMVNPNLDGKLMSRRNAWYHMFNASAIGTNTQSRRGGCPNQDLFQSEGILFSAKAAQYLRPEFPPLYSDEQFIAFVDQSTGFVDQARFPENGPFFTESGMALECFGILGGGGLDMNYGQLAVSLLTNVAIAVNQTIPNQAARTYKYTKRMLDDMTHLSHTFYQSKRQDDINGNSPYDFIRLPSVIDTRIEHSPDKNVNDNSFSTSWHMANTHRHPQSIRFLQILLTYGQWPGQIGGLASTGPDVAMQTWYYHNELLELINGFHADNNEWITVPPLPMELAVVAVNGSVVATPDMAWVEPTAAAVAIKHGNERLWFNINWRHPTAQPNGQAKMTGITPDHAVIAIMTFNYTNGFFGLFTLQYAQYFIAINRANNTQSDPFVYHFAEWAVNYSVRSVVTELQSGIRYDLSSVDDQRRLVLQPQASYVMVEERHDENNQIISEL